MNLRILAATLLFVPASTSAADGRKIFRDQCVGCHGADARGTGKAPGLAGSPRLSGNSIAQVRDIIERGSPDSGMPAFALPTADLDAVAAYVHNMNASIVVPPPPGTRITWGKPQQGDWLTYNGKLSGNRYSELK